MLRTTSQLRKKEQLETEILIQSPCCSFRAYSGWELLQNLVFCIPTMQPHNHSNFVLLHDSPKVQYLIIHSIPSIKLSNYCEKTLLRAIKKDERNPILKKYVMRTRYHRFMPSKSAITSHLNSHLTFAWDVACIHPLNGNLEFYQRRCGYHSNVSLQHLQEL